MENKLQKTNTLPTLNELYEANIEIAFKNDQFNLLVNQQPKKEWVKENKFAGNSKYIPIGIVETMLQRIFKKYRIEILREGTAFNGVYVVVRVHYLNLMNSEWDWHDGVGAVQLQTKAGASPAQLENINNNALMMAFPMAKSYAIKDAVEHIGKLFGRDLNRKDVLEYTTSISINETADNKEKNRIENHIKNSKTIQELTDINLKVVIHHGLKEYYENKLNELSKKI